MDVLWTLVLDPGVLTNTCLNRTLLLCLYRFSNFKRQRIRTDSLGWLAFVFEEPCRKFRELWTRFGRKVEVNTGGNWCRCTGSGVGTLLRTRTRSDESRKTPSMTRDAGLTGRWVSDKIETEQTVLTRDNGDTTLQGDCEHHELRASGRPNPWEYCGTRAWQHVNNRT